MRVRPSKKTPASRDQSGGLSQTSHRDRHGAVPVDREPAYLAYQVDPSYPGEGLKSIGLGWMRPQNAVYVVFDRPVSGEVVLYPVSPGPSWGKPDGRYPDYEVFQEWTNRKSTRIPVVGYAWDKGYRKIKIRLPRQQTALFLRRFRPLEKVIEI